jgi:toxin ParE1/3/4
MEKKCSGASVSASRKLVPEPKFILAPCVESELAAIWEFIAMDNPDAAICVIDSAYETLAALARTPGLGRSRKFRDPRLKGVRSWHISGFENYLIFYRGIPGGIQVLHIYHGARDIEALFGGK